MKKFIRKVPKLPKVLYDWGRNSLKRIELYMGGPAQDMPLDTAKLPEIPNSNDTREGWVGRLKRKQDAQAERKSNIIKKWKRKLWAKL